MSKGNVLDNYRAKNGAFVNDPMFQALKMLHNWKCKNLKWHNDRYSISGVYDANAEYIPFGAYRFGELHGFGRMKFTFLEYDFVTGEFEVGVHDGSQEK